MTQVTSAVQRPASGSQRTRLSLDHLGNTLKKKKKKRKKRKKKEKERKKISWPLGGSRTVNSLSLRTTYLGVAEEGVENLPHQDDRAQQQVGDADPKNAGRESICELQPVAASLILWFQAPLVLKQRACTHVYKCVDKEFKTFEWSLLKCNLGTQN